MPVPARRRQLPDVPHCESELPQDRQAIHGSHLHACRRAAAARIHDPPMRQTPIPYLLPDGRTPRDRHQRNVRTGRLPAKRNRILPRTGANIHANALHIRHGNVLHRTGPRNASPNLCRKGSTQEIQTKSHDRPIAPTFHGILSIKSSPPLVGRIMSLYTHSDEEEKERIKVFDFSK